MHITLKQLTLNNPVQFRVVNTDRL